MSGGYRMRCQARRGRSKFDPDKSSAKYHRCNRNRHYTWEWAAEAAANDGSTYWHSRRQRRTWQPSGEKAQQNRARDAAIRGWRKYCEETWPGHDWPWLDVKGQYL